MQAMVVVGDSEQGTIIVVVVVEQSCNSSAGFLFTFTPIKVRRKHHHNIITQLRHVPGSESLCFKDVLCLSLYCNVLFYFFQIVKFGIYVTSWIQFCGTAIPSLTFTGMFLFLSMHIQNR